MPDLCDLILDDHETFRRRFAELDELRGGNAGAETLDGVWGPLADLLETHAAAEEELFYPRLLRRGANAEDETQDAIGDHNEIRDGVRRAEAQRTGSRDWWEAVEAARRANSDHMAEEEREALADFRQHAERRLRLEMGARWLRFADVHAGAQDVDDRDKDPERYIARHV